MGGMPNVPADVAHASDCAVHNEPAYPAGPCDCGAVRPHQEREDKMASETDIFPGAARKVTAKELRYLLMGGTLPGTLIPKPQLTQLDRIEAKLDRIIRYMFPNETDSAT